MPIPVSCVCGQRMNAPDARAGMTVRCPRCAKVVNVPAVASSAEPHVDKALGDPVAQRLRADLARGEWRAAHETLQTTRRWPDREFYVTALGDWPGRPAWLDEWVAAHPGSPGARLVRGYHFIRWAWEARGGGQAESVKDRSWDDFFKRLRLAEQDLNAAAAMDPDDPTPWACLLIAARGLQLEPSEAMRRFEEATRRDADHRLAHHMMMVALMEKWGGNHSLMFSFARDAARRASPGSGLPSLVAEAHVERWLFADSFDGDKDFAASYFADGAVKMEIGMAHDKSIGSASHRETRLTIHDRNLFSFCFYLMEQDDLARKELEAMGDRVTELPWGYLNANAAAAVRKARKAVGLPS